jgi:hypothetical protein
MAVADIDVARTFTKDEIADITGASVEAVRKMAQEIIPPEWRLPGDGREQRYAPLTVVLLVFLDELHARFGPRSPIPRQVARQVLPKLEAAWRERQQARCVVSINGMDITIPRITALDEARRKLAAIA